MKRAHSRSHETSLFLKRVLKIDPGLYFLVAGGLIFAAFTWLEVRSAEPIVIDDRVRMALAADFEARIGREPLPDELAEVEQRYVEDELLFRDAVDRALYLQDGAVRDYLVSTRRRQIYGALRPPTESELESFFFENQSRYAVDGETARLEDVRAQVLQGYWRAQTEDNLSRAIERLKQKHDVIVLPSD